MDDKKKRAEYMRQWWQRDLEGNRRKARERRKARAEKVAAERKRFYEAHRDEIAAEAKAKREADPWRASMIAKACTANRRYPGHVTWQDVGAVFERCGRTCMWCGKSGLSGRDLTLEHIRPVNDPKYLGVSCSGCNIARIPARGPRKSEDEKMMANRKRASAWRLANLEKANARWGRMSAQQRAARREYMTVYMRKRRAGRKE